MRSRSAPAADRWSRTGRCPASSPGRSPPGSGARATAPKLPCHRAAPGSAPRRTTAGPRTPTDLRSRHARTARIDEAPTRRAASAGRSARRASLDLRVGPRRRREPEQLRDECVGVLDRHALAREPAIEQPCRPKGLLHRLVEGRVVVGRDRVQRDPQQLGLDDVLGGEGRVEVGRVERIDPVPECDVRRGRFLRLERDDPMDRIDDADRLAPEQKLPRKGRSVEQTSGEGHGRNPRGQSRARCTRKGTARATSVDGAQAVHHERDRQAAAGLAVERVTQDVLDLLEPVGDRPGRQVEAPGGPGDVLTGIEDMPGASR